MAELSLAAQEPGTGIKTEIEGIRGLIVGNYILFYEIVSNEIVIVEVWDNRRNPEKLRLFR